MDARTNEINVRFLDEQPSLPRQNFSARWRGYFFVSRAQTIEFFAGGNDEVELRVDGESLLRRSLADGMRTAGRKIHVDAGAHEIAVDYQQFGGSMALNIQRALEGREPAPFPPRSCINDTSTRATSSCSTRRAGCVVTRHIWSACALLLIGVSVAANFGRWRRSAAPRTVRDYARRVRLVTAPALLGPAVVFALGPHTIFANNASEFAVVYTNSQRRGCCEQSCSTG